MPYELRAVVQRPGTQSYKIHTHGDYATADLARWWAINAQGVYQEGHLGPRLIYIPRQHVLYWEIEFVP